MIKALFFAASALLFPCLAFGGDTTTDLSVQVVPPSRTGAIPPAAAAAAGFTTLALNSDFTQPLPANWLGGCTNPGNGQPVSPQFHDDGGPHIWWMNIWWSANYQSCNTVQLNDPAYGGLVLDMPWTIDSSYSSVGTVIETASWDYNRSTGTGQAHTFPHGLYIEVTSRATPVAMPGVYTALFTWGQDGIA